MQDKRFILIKINNAWLSCFTIDNKYITFYTHDSKVYRTINISNMLTEIVDIPMYFKNLMDKGDSLISLVSESEAVNLNDLFDINEFFEDDCYEEEEIERCPDPNIVKIFDIDNNMTKLLIRIIPKQNKLYYNIAVYTQYMLIMDIIMDPRDAMYIDTVNNCMHTMEQGHCVYNFEPSRLFDFLNPKCKKLDGKQNTKSNNTMFI